MSDARSSRIEGLHKMAPEARLQAVARQAGLGNAAIANLSAAAQGQIELADRLVENAISAMSIPVGIATNMIVDGHEVLVPMATEESSVVAAVCNAAKRCRPTGGFRTSSSGPVMAAQIQILDCLHLGGQSVATCPCFFSRQTSPTPGKCQGFAPVTH